MKTHLTKQGYKSLSLVNKNGEIKTVRIHKIIALVFVENIYNKPYVNHIDGNKLNNKADNLEWCTPMENSKHAYENNLLYKFNVKIKKIKVTNLITKEIKYFDTTVECSRYFNVNKGTIYRVLNKNKNKIYKNKLKFEYID